MKIGNRQNPASKRLYNSKFCWNVINSITEHLTRTQNRKQNFITADKPQLSEAQLSWQPVPVCTWDPQQAFHKYIILRRYCYTKSPNNSVLFSFAVPLVFTDTSHVPRPRTRVILHRSLYPSVATLCYQGNWHLWTPHLSSTILSTRD